MPAVARGDSTETVSSATGSGIDCADPSTTSTDQCSANVFVNSIGVVRKDDKVTSHAATGCVPESPGLSSYSSTVFANSKNIGRAGDNYNGDGSNIIDTGSPNVFAGG
jgi:hypothetical protein